MSKRTPKPKSYIINLVELIDEKRDTSNLSNKPDRQEYLTFSRGTSRFGIPHHAVKEVHVSPVITNVPGAIEPFTSLFYASGAVIPVVDLAIAVPEDSCPQYVIRLDMEHLKLGIFADHVVDILPLYPDRKGRSVSGRILLPVRFADKVMADDDGIRYRVVDLDAIRNAIQEVGDPHRNEAWT